MKEEGGEMERESDLGDRERLIAGWRGSDREREKREVEADEERKEQEREREGRMKKLTRNGKFSLCWIEGERE